MDWPRHIPTLCHFPQQSLRAHVDQESPGSPDNENLGPIDMFGSPEPPIAVVHPARVDATIPSITAIGLPTAGLVRHPRGNSPSDSDADLDDARSMFGPGSSGLAGDGDTSGNNMFTTDDEGADTTDIHMFSSDNDSDIVAVDMFSEVGSRPASPRTRPQEFSEVDFAGLDESLFDLPSGQNSDGNDSE